MKNKLTQYEKVKAFCLLTIKSKGFIATWDIESLGRRYNMMSGSATRYARKLCELGIIKHDGKNRHVYV